MFDGLSERRRSCRRDPALQADRGHARAEEVAVPLGADERLSPAGRKILVGEAAFLPAIHASRNQLHLRGLVCSLSDAGIARRWRGREFLPAVLDFSANPVVVVLNVVALSFLLLHAVTWFGSAPRAMVIQVRGRRVPARAVLAGHYAAWLVVSVIVAWMVLS